MTLQCEAYEQFKLQNGELAPDRILIKLHTDQGNNGLVIIDLAFFQPLNQILQRLIVQPMQVENIFAVIQCLVGVVPD